MDLQVWDTSVLRAFAISSFSILAFLLLKIILRISSLVLKGKQRGTAPQGRAGTEEVGGCSLPRAEVCFCSQNGWLGPLGRSTSRVRRTLGAREPHVSEPQPLNRENQSSSCRVEPGHSCEEAGKRGRAHSHCSVSGWYWLRHGISDNVSGSCTKTSALGGTQAGAPGNTGMMWIRSGVGMSGTYGTIKIN